MTPCGSSEDFALILATAILEAQWFRLKGSNANISTQRTHTDKATGRVVILYFILLIFEALMSLSAVIKSDAEKKTFELG